MVLLDLCFKNISIFSMFLLISATNAEDYGKQGNTFEIQEQNLLEVIGDRLKEVDVEKWQKDFRHQVFKSIHKPKPTLLPYAKENRVYYYDPSITLQQNYFDHNGVIFARAGTRINPLDSVNLSNNLIFIDGNNKIQLNWALQQYHRNNGLVKIILLNGAIIDLMKDTKVRLYFDQNGFLVKKFNLRSIPAFISQEKRLLKIEEVVLNYE